jgi:glycosyltransferase involved in cell wall biosynthesis
MELNKVKLVCKQRFDFEGKTYFPGEVTSQIERVAKRWVSRGLCDYPDPNEVIHISYEKHEKVSIVILVKDALEYVKKCIESLLKHTDNFELIVVDNNSKAETKKYLKDISCDEYTLITNDKNKGISYSWNQGIKIAKYDYICFLNSDCIVTADWLKKLMRGFKYGSSIGIVGPSSNGGPTVKSPQIVGDIIVEKINEYARDLPEDFSEASVVGFCFLIARKVFDKIGVFDYKRYGLACHEDIDFLYRALKSGFKSLWCKSSFVYHYGNRTMLEMGLNAQGMRDSTLKILKERQNDPDIYINNDIEPGNIEIISDIKVKIGFVTLQHIETDRVASTRLRVEWPLAYMPGSFESEEYEDLKKCDAVVFQSRHNYPDLEMAVKLKNNGVKLIWDFTDPSWLKEYDSSAIHPILYKVAELADVVTFPTEELARTYKEAFQGTNTAIIKDRLELSHYAKIKTHKEHKNYKICWHGSYGNFCSLDLARNDLEKLGKEFDITLICVYDTGNRHNIQVKPFKNIKLDIRTWTNQITTDAILESDITINPKFDGHWKSYKSNNKTITSWICGVPCIERNFYDEIKKYLLSADLRNKEAKIKRAIVEKEYDVKLTAKEWIFLVNKLITKSEPEIISENKTELIKTRRNIAVYTSICGGYDDLKENQYKTGKADYIAFIDRSIISDVWNIKKVFTQFIDPSRQAKIYKILPYLYMPDYEYSIWMDGSVILKTEPAELIEKYLNDNDIALFQHHKRDDIYEEYQADEGYRFGSKPYHRQNEPGYLYKMQIERYKNEGFPQHSGLFECTIILRKHTEQIKRLCEMWWSEISSYTVCDQHSFIYCIKKLGIKVNTIPGNIFSGEMFTRVEHERK